MPMTRKGTTTMRRATMRFGLAAAAIILAAGPSARADVTINIEQVGGHVVVTGSGSISLVA